MSHRKTTGVPAAALLAGGFHQRRDVVSSTPDVNDQIADIRNRLRLDLVLSRHADNCGSNYEWQDGDGRVVCSGSAQGSIYTVKVEAVRHLEIDDSLLR